MARDLITEENEDEGSIAKSVAPTPPTASSATNAAEYTNNPSLLAAVATLMFTEYSATASATRVESKEDPPEVHVEDIEDDSPPIQCNEDADTNHRQKQLEIEQQRRRLQ